MSIACIRQGIPSRIRRIEQRGMHMLDLLMLAIGLGFFALAVGYVHACDRL
jgi:hypothetical protein